MKITNLTVTPLQLPLKTPASPELTPVKGLLSLPATAGLGFELNMDIVSMVAERFEVTHS